MKTLLEDGPLIARVHAMERAVGLGQWADGAEFFTTEAMYHVGRRGLYRGIEGIRTYMEWQRRFVEWRGHDPKMMITYGDTVIIEVVSLFHRLSDAVDLSIPCTDIYRFDGDRIRDWGVYADTSTFFGPKEAEQSAPNEAMAE